MFTTVFISFNLKKGTVKMGKLWKENDKFRAKVISDDGKVLGVQLSGYGKTDIIVDAKKLESCCIRLILKAVTIRLHSTRQNVSVQEAGELYDVIEHHNSILSQRKESE